MSPQLASCRAKAHFLLPPNRIAVEDEGVFADPVVALAGNAIVAVWADQVMEVNGVAAVLVVGIRSIVSGKHALQGVGATQVAEFGERDMHLGVAAEHRMATRDRRASGTDRDVCVSKPAMGLKLGVLGSDTVGVLKRAGVAGVSVRQRTGELDDRPAAVVRDSAICDRVNLHDFGFIVGRQFGQSFGGGSVGNDDPIAGLPIDALAERDRVRTNPCSAVDLRPGADLLLFSHAAVDVGLGVVGVGCVVVPHIRPVDVDDAVGEQPAGEVAFVDRL